MKKWNSRVQDSISITNCYSVFRLFFPLHCLLFIFVNYGMNNFPVLSICGKSGMIGEMLLQTCAHTTFGKADVIPIDLY